MNAIEIEMDEDKYDLLTLATVLVGASDLETFIVDAAIEKAKELIQQAQRSGA